VAKITSVATLTAVAMQISHRKLSGKLEKGQSSQLLNNPMDINICIEKHLADNLSARSQAAETGIHWKMSVPAQADVNRIKNTE